MKWLFALTQVVRFGLWLLVVLFVVLPFFEHDKAVVTEMIRVSALYTACMLVLESIRSSLLREAKKK